VSSIIFYSLFGSLVADGWCWFVLREKYCWLVAAGWFVVREKYCWLVADKPSEHGDGTSEFHIRLTPTVKGKWKNASCVGLIGPWAI
jgi:hypothetical protein